MTELAGAGYEERTCRNVADSDATIIIHFGDVDGGTALTVRRCMIDRKPHLLVDAEQRSVRQAVEDILRFIDAHAVATLNVAGPRASKAPRAHEYTRQVFRLVIDGLRR